jgi:hypothetical protein
MTKIMPPFERVTKTLLWSSIFSTTEINNKLDEKERKNEQIAYTRESGYNIHNNDKNVMKNMYRLQIRTRNGSTQVTRKREKKKNKTNTWCRKYRKSGSWMSYATVRWKKDKKNKCENSALLRTITINNNNKWERKELKLDKPINNYG